MSEEAVNHFIESLVTAAAFHISYEKNVYKIFQVQLLKVIKTVWLKLIRDAQTKNNGKKSLFAYIWIYSFWTGQFDYRVTCFRVFRSFLHHVTFLQNFTLICKGKSTIPIKIRKQSEREVRRALEMCHIYSDRIHNEFCWAAFFVTILNAYKLFFAYSRSHIVNCEIS